MSYQELADELESFRVQHQNRIPIKVEKGLVLTFWENKWYYMEVLFVSDLQNTDVPYLVKIRYKRTNNIFYFKLDIKGVMLFLWKISLNLTIDSPNSLDMNKERIRMRRLLKSNVKIMRNKK